ncbi:MAG: hypothetical protein AAGH68_12585 [Pseudomonadota bacterium]
MHADGGDGRSLGLDILFQPLFLNFKPLQFLCQGRREGACLDGGDDPGDLLLDAGKVLAGAIGMVLLLRAEPVRGADIFPAELFGQLRCE